jgi:hypothetical protein
LSFPAIGAPPAFNVTGYQLSFSIWRGSMVLMLSGRFGQTEQMAATLGEDLPRRAPPGFPRILSAAKARSAAMLAQARAKGIKTKCKNNKSVAPNHAMTPHFGAGRRWRGFGDPAR